MNISEFSQRISQVTQHDGISWLPTVQQRWDLTSQYEMEDTCPKSTYASLLIPRDRKR